MFDTMHHVISIPKKAVSKYRIDKLELALAVLNGENSDHLNACLAVDSSGEFYEISVMDSSLRRAEQMKYFAVGFLNMPELE